MLPPELARRQIAADRPTPVAGLQPRLTKDRKQLCEAEISACNDLDKQVRREESSNGSRE